MHNTFDQWLRELASLLDACWAAEQCNRLHRQSSQGNQLLAGHLQVVGAHHGTCDRWHPENNPLGSASQAAAASSQIALLLLCVADEVMITSHGEDAQPYGTAGIYHYQVRCSNLLHVMQAASSGHKHAGALQHHALQRL